jgi:hypothetical protein
LRSTANAWTASAVRGCLSRQRFGQSLVLADTHTWLWLANLSIPAQMQLISRLPPATAEWTASAREHRSTGTPYEFCASNSMVFVDPCGLEECRDWVPNPWHWGEVCYREIVPPDDLRAAGHRCIDSDGNEYQSPDRCGPACGSFLGYCIYCPVHTFCHFIFDIVGGELFG